MSRTSLARHIVNVCNWRISSWFVLFSVTEVGGDSRGRRGGGHSRSCICKLYLRLGRIDFTDRSSILENVVLISPWIFLITTINSSINLWKTKTSMSDLTANQQLQRCYIQTLPLELLEIVFGMLNINDLGRMLCTSEWIKVPTSLCSWQCWQ